MKVIDLLNKIANGEEVPKEVKYDRFIYKWCEDIGDYRIDGYGECLLIKTIFGTFDCCGRHNSLYNMIYDEVEIVEIVEEPEEKKIPEKLIPTSLKGIDNLDEKIEIAHIDTISVIETVNQVIDYLKSKGE